MSKKKNHSIPNENKVYSIEKPIFIITGDIAEGKTHFTAKLVNELQKKGLDVGGFYSPRVMDGDRTIGYDLIALSNHERIVFLRESKTARDIGRFSVHPKAFSRVASWVSSQLKSGTKLYIIDEVGKWEMKREGWSQLIAQLLLKENVWMIWVVRDSFVDQITQYWDIPNPIIFKIQRANPVEAANRIITMIKSTKKS